MTTTIVYVLGSAYVLFILYLSYVTLWEAKRNGKLAAAPWPVKAVAWSIILLMLAADVVFNITVGSMVYVEPPNVRRLTFTARCKHWLEDTSWRGRIARWVCHGWLNPFQEGHC